MTCIYWFIILLWFSYSIPEKITFHLKSVRFHTLLHIRHLYKNSKNELLSTCGVVRSAQGAVSDLITAMTALLTNNRVVEFAENCYFCYLQAKAKNLRYYKPYFKGIRFFAVNLTPTLTPKWAKLCIKLSNKPLKQ